MKENILVRGEPGVGKTTLMQKIAARFNGAKGGFYTEEMRERGERVGFKIKSFDGREGLLAHVGVFSNYRVGRYFVNIHDLDDIAVNSILSSLDSDIIFIDEIGKMELFSERFRQAVLMALETRKVVGTLKASSDEFSSRIAEREDTRIFELDRGKMENLVGEIVELLGQ